MTRQQIIDYVVAKMDEIHPTNQGETIQDKQVETQLDASAVSLMEALPSVLADPKTAVLTANDLSDHIEGFSVTLKCPDDYIRLHRLKLNDWIRPVTDLFPDGDRLLWQQDYDYIKSTKRRPAASIYHKDERYYITCYPAIGEAPAVEEFVYVKKPAAAEDIGDHLVELLAWKCAGHVFQVAGQFERTQACEQRLGEIVQAKLKYRS